MSGKVKMLASHARTMCMMYRVTKDKKYLTRARQDIAKAKSIKSSLCASQHDRQQSCKTIQLSVMLDEETRPAHSLRLV